MDKVSADLYADDTTLYDIQTSLEAIEVNLQEALNQLHIWCKNNGMVLNSVKTKVMLVTTKEVIWMYIYFPWEISGLLFSFLK